jgi:hypothetical protein
MKCAVQNVLWVLVAMLAPLAASSAQAALVNADFEDGDLTGWNPFGDTIAVSTADPFAGTYHADLSADDIGDNYAGMFQDQAAGAGELWEATIWARLVASPGGSAIIRLKLEFITTDFGTVQIDDALLTTVSGSYSQLVASGVAPDTTTAVRITPVVELNGAIGTIQGYFDNATLTLIPEPASLTLLAPAALGLIRRKR